MTITEETPAKSNDTAKASVAEVLTELNTDPWAPVETLPEAERIAELEARLADAKAEMEAFKLKVSEGAMKMAEEHNLCGVVELTMRDLGLPIPEAEHDYVVLYSVRLRMTTASREGDVNAAERKLEDNTRATLTLGDGANAAGVQLVHGSNLSVYDVRRC